MRFKNEVLNLGEKYFEVEFKFERFVKDNLEKIISFISKNDDFEIKDGYVTDKRTNRYLMELDPLMIFDLSGILIILYQMAREMEKGEV